MKTNALDVRKFVQDLFDDGITVASVGGSGTMHWDTTGRDFPLGLGNVVENGVIVKTLYNIATPFGLLPSLKVLNVNGHPVVRVPFHGWKLPFATQEQMMANFWVLNQLGVKIVLADASVGGMCGRSPWDIIIPEDVIPCETSTLNARRLAEKLEKETWVRMNEPFCRTVKKILIAQVLHFKETQSSSDFHGVGDVIQCGVTQESPIGAFETAAQVRMYQNIVPGVVAVNQSSGLEALMARVLGMHYVVLHIVANYAEGQSGGKWNSDPGGMHQFYEECPGPVASVLWKTLKELVNLSEINSCPCRNAGDELRLAEFS